MCFENASYSYVSTTLIFAWGLGGPVTVSSLVGVVKGANNCSPSRSQVFDDCAGITENPTDGGHIMIPPYVPLICALLAGVT